MKTLLTLLSVLFSSAVLADFSQSQATLHPRYPATEPFIIEVSGTWPTDCHPGEQKPVINSFDGQNLEIGFEIIIVHITCNISDTQYRVLVDMSEAVRSDTPPGNMLNIRVSFDGGTLEQILTLVCPDLNGCQSPARSQLKPEPGYYPAPDRANQGLLVIRQNTGTGIFPLVYDQSGRSEWLFSGNHIMEASFFAEIFRLSGGDCFACDPSGTQPGMTSMGHISVLVDQPGILQVKVNDGLFSEYQRLVYGNSTFPVGPAGEHTLIDLSGRWGISENWGTNPPVGDLTEFFPGAFDIELDGSAPAANVAALDTWVSYLVSTPTGEELGQLECRGQIGFDGRTNVCEFIDPTDAAEPLFLFYQDGPSTLSLQFARPVIAVGVPPGGKAIRLD